MFAARLAAVGVAVLVLVSSAEAKPARITAPTSLHGFLLRADEPTVHSFARTPAFAWKPVAGAVRYQFQLSTSLSFRENGIVYQTSSLTTPVAAPTITLPWISGNPYALYARVRGILRHTSTPWSAAFGFDMDAPAAPTPEPTDAPGLLRWTPVEGAEAYEVWFVDIPKHEVVYTNVIDEREFYTFHRDASWTGTIRWRVRSLRADHDSDKRLNGLPPVGYGPWSPIYQSSNSAYRGGSIQLLGTESDVYSTGSDSSPAHRLMPAFLFSGDQTVDGRGAELFRVYVFTDKQCLNRVFTSAVVGGPAYAPRPYGPLPLPQSADAVPTARASYFSVDGVEPNAYMYDGEPVQTDESKAPASPTVAVPDDADTSSGSGPAAPAAPSQLSVTGNLGAPVDLWDTDWPQGGYWWTVIPVEAVAPGALSTYVSAQGAVSGSAQVAVVTSVGFSPGDVVTIGTGPNFEAATIVGVAPGTLTVATNLARSHGPGEQIMRTGGSLRYQDMEMPQDVCAPPYRRVKRFGKNSEPSLTSAGELFASGLSSAGRLTAGNDSKAFYGNPLVSWTPALGADAYEVQWSKTRYPFRPQPNPQNQNALGTMTLGTSAVLPLTPGVWYYRVRGFNFSGRTGAQEMAWSDPARIVVARPKFRVVPGK
jgi:hypothetical protein